MVHMLMKTHVSFLPLNSNASELKIQFSSEVCTKTENPLSCSPDSNRPISTRHDLQVCELGDAGAVLVQGLDSACDVCCSRVQVRDSPVKVTLHRYREPLGSRHARVRDVVQHVGVNHSII